jgi:hypothetical protein
MPLLLIIGFATGHATYAAVAAGAAFSVGFGAARDLRGRRWAAMGSAAIGITLAAFVGSLAGQWPAALVLIAATMAAACAGLALFDEDLWWVALQVVIALLVAGYYPGGPGAALQRAAAVLVGGGVQIVVVIGLARLFPAAARRLPANPAKPAPAPRLLIGHMVRAGIGVAGALMIARAFGLANSYWAPMTALLVLKPGLGDTQTRGVQRLIGTFMGCLVATGFALAVGNVPVAVVLALGLTAGAAFALQKAHYASLTCAVTATVVLLLTLGHGGVVQNAEHRLWATLLGGAIALAVARIAPHREAPPAPTEDRIGQAAPIEGAA